MFLFHSFLLKNVTTAIPPAARRTVRYPAIFALSPVTTAVLPTFPPFPPGVGFGCVLGTKTFISCFQSRFRRIHIILCRIRICKRIFFCFCTGFIKCRPAFCCVPVRFNVFIRFIKILQSAYICSARVWIRCVGSGSGFVSLS